MPQPSTHLAEPVSAVSAPRWIVAALLFLGGFSLCAVSGRCGLAGEPTRPDPATWAVPDIDTLPDDERGRLIRSGRRLVTETYALVGPLVADPAKRYAGNNLACSNCHLDAGTKKFGLPIYGLYGEFPHYSARAGKDVSLEDRLNSCMTRSLNGKPLPIDGAEMLAFVAYIRFLAFGLAPGERLAGHGAPQIPELDRPADPARGEAIYTRACLGCHDTDGSGIARSPEDLALGYAVPPLWGADSFNDGAGMARLITLAGYLHADMPHGADYLDPILSVEAAWDVAAYVESKPRPRKEGLDRDFPDLLQKPVDTPYGPYADRFTETQHKYGPFAPIRAALAELKAAKQKAWEKRR
jgi:thiosulfate dehydrogenase